MKRLVRTVFDRLGVEISSRRPTLQELQQGPRGATAGKIVEFIGPQGVGKSTLSDAAYPRIKDNWFCRTDLTRPGPSATRHPALEELHKAIFLHHMETLQTPETDPWHCLKNTSQMVQVIAENLTMMSHDFARGFFLDEGMVKNLPDAVLTQSATTPELIWPNRAFIYLDARDPNCVLERYKKRFEERKARGLPQRQTPDDILRARIARDRDMFARVLDMAHQFDCPILTLDAEDPHDTNLTRILDFDRDLRRGYEGQGH